MRITELLLEYDRAFTLQKVGSAITAPAAREQLTVEQAIEALEQMDPTANKQYVPWLAKQYIAGQFKTQDADQVKQVLTNFVSLKSRLPVEQRDLGRMDFSNLLELIDSIINAEVGTGDTADAGTFPVVPNSKVLYNGPFGQLSVPETKKASCELGRGTKWCTSATKNNKFDEYSKTAPLYVWKDRDGSKWQFYFNKDDPQAMDAGNKPINATKLDYFRTQHPIVKKLFKQQEAIIAKDPRAVAKYAKDIIKGRWPEAEKIIATTPSAALDYAMNVIKGPWPQGEKIIVTDPQSASYYARNIIKGPWPEAEKIIAKDPWTAVDYAKDVIGGRWPEAEAAIATAPQSAVNYARRVIGGPWPEAEKIIAENPAAAADYVMYVIKGRWPEGEAAIATNPQAAYGYATNVIKGRWPEGEAAIATHPWAASAYAAQAIKGRWPEAEATIATDPNALQRYQSFLRNMQ